MFKHQDHRIGEIEKDREQKNKDGQHIHVVHAIQTMLLERKHMENAGATERKEEKSRQERKKKRTGYKKTEILTQRKTVRQTILYTFFFSERKRRRTSQKF